jgi:hypothetical protein
MDLEEGDLESKADFVIDNAPSSVCQTAMLSLGRRGSSRFSCSTLPFLPARVRSPFVQGSVPTQKSVNNRAGNGATGRGRRVFVKRRRLVPGRKSF